MIEGKLKKQMELYLGKSMQSIMFEAEELNKQQKGIAVDPNPLCDYYTKNEELIKLLDEAKKEFPTENPTMYDEYWVKGETTVPFIIWFKKWFGDIEQ